MGCCFSNDEDKEEDEQRRPLINPISDGPSPQPMGGYNSTEVHHQQKGDEQSALNRILQEVASNVVDVAALDTQGIDTIEFTDRARQYSQRLAGVSTQAQRIHSLPTLPMGVAAPQVVLSGQTISLADVQLITSATQQASKAFQEVKVRHKEDLVVPFGVP